MTDREKIQASLAQIAAEDNTDARGSRILSPNAQKSLIQALLSEIDDTILPRELSITNARGQSIQFEVAGGRLIRVSDTTGFDASEVISTFFGKPLQKSDGDVLSQLGKFCQDFVAATDMLKVRATALTAARDPANIGCPAQDLAAAWGVKFARPGSTHATDAAAEFVRRSMEFCDAAITLKSGAIIERSGAVDDLQQLETLVQSDLGTLIAPVVAVSGEELQGGYVFLASANGAEQSIVLVYCGELTALIAGPKEVETRFHTLWRELEIAQPI